jgi:hypothetical protein
MIRGKTVDEALSLSSEELSGELGPLPPMKIHCSQLVEGALRSALDPANAPPVPANPTAANNAEPLDSKFQPKDQAGSGLRIVFLPPDP